MRLLLLSLILVSLSTPAHAASARPYPVTNVRVIDGDTMALTVELGFNLALKVKVRLAKIDTPEVYGFRKTDPRRKPGLEASAFSKEWVLASAELEIRAPDGRWRQGKYGRWLVLLCRPDGECLADALRAAGHVKQKGQ